MSRVTAVIKNKNKVNRERRNKVRSEIQRLNNKSKFRARLQSELNRLDVLLDQEGVDKLIIEVPEKSVALFTEAIYSGEFSEYVLKQMDGEANKFMISKEYIEV